METRLNKRQFIGLLGASAAGATATTAAPAIAQDIDLSFTPAEAGKIHRQELDDALNRLDGRSPVEPDGLRLLLDRLAEDGLITEEGHHLIVELIEWVFSEEPLDQLRLELEWLLARARDTFEELAETIVEIAIGSVEVALGWLEDVGRSTTAQVIAFDISGAISGADLGARLFRHPAAMVVGATIGAASGSIIGFGQTRAS